MTEGNGAAPHHAQARADNFTLSQSTFTLPLDAAWDATSAQCSGQPPQTRLELVYDMKLLCLL